MNNKISIVTTSRADYSALTPLIKKLEECDDFNLSLIATGSHLSSLHGETIKLIERDGIIVDKKVPLKILGDSEYDICNGIASGLSGFSALFSHEPPDLIIILGDRYELWSVSIAAIIHKIPIAHIYGGEITLGQIDDSIRHSITKMSSFHFASTRQYAQRIIQMGECPKNVFEIGALSIDAIHEVQLMSKQELSSTTGLDFNQDIALMTYHPVTLDDYNSATGQIQTVLNSLLKIDLKTLVTMPNADTSGTSVLKEIESYAQLYPNKFKLIKNMGRTGYYSAMKHAKLMIGNSSSGVIESMSFKMPVVNIGDRQAGRIIPPNAISCNCSESKISEAIKIALSPEFNLLFSKKADPLGSIGASEKIINILKSIDLNQKTNFIKKRFYDIDFCHKTE